MRRKVRRDIVGWRLFRARDTFHDIAIVLFITSSGRLRATIGLWHSFKKNPALEISNTGERLTFEEAYPFFKQHPEMIKENYDPA